MAAFLRSRMLPNWKTNAPVISLLVIFANEFTTALIVSVIRDGLPFKYPNTGCINLAQIRK
jgi:hypothetical protein